MQRTGIIAALDAEAEAIFPGEGEWRDGARIVAHAGGSAIIVTSGIGKVNAAVAATRLAIEHKAALLLVVGTAGALRPLEGPAFEIAEAIQHDYGAARPGAFAHYSAGDWPIGEAMLVPFAAHPLGSGLAKVCIVSGDAFVECPDQSARLRDALGGELVDMETAAVAQAAVALGLPWAAIKAVTDSADGDGAGDFMANLKSAARRAGVAAEGAIARLASLATPLRP